MKTIKDYSWFYGHFRHHNCPVGLDEVEIAHRHILQERPKILGVCWHENSINHLLALREVQTKGRWDEFWSRCQQGNVVCRAASPDIDAGQPHPSRWLCSGSVPNRRTHDDDVRFSPLSHPMSEQNSRRLDMEETVRAL